VYLKEKAFDKIQTSIFASVKVGDIKNAKGLIAIR
jgi:hypothetical protein